MDAEKIISIDELKNENNVNKSQNISADIVDENIELDENDTDDIEEMTPARYKKFLKKKVNTFTEEEKNHYNKLAQKNKRKKDKKEEILKENTEKIELDEEKQSHLYNQLFVLKQKFPDNTENIIIEKDMNIKTLESKKDLIVKIISDKHSHNVIFESLLLLCRTGERTMDYFDLDMLDGYADNVDNHKDDIVPILREMIDLGEIDTSMLTPHLRLAVILSSVAVKTIEKNNDKKKNAILVSVSAPGTGGGDEK
tara:strand:+ start:807 stop:1568 length:762 start_codon:yes stop_codon:yes gene_type:complete